MLKDDPNFIVEAADLIVRDNLIEGCQELHEYKETGILRDGVVRGVARLYQQIMASDSLGVAETLFKNAAVSYVAKEGKT